MGRTNPTYRDALRAIEERWAEFRRALRRRDQPRTVSEIADRSDNYRNTINRVALR
jgi:hypothetical protein